MYICHYKVNGVNVSKLAFTMYVSRKLTFRGTILHGIIPLYLHDLYSVLGGAGGGGGVWEGLAN